MKKYKMHFYDTYNLVREKVPIAQIEPSHISALKKLFDVGLLRGVIRRTVTGTGNDTISRI